jgi:Ca2+-binding RTX toxin-like protein
MVWIIPIESSSADIDLGTTDSLYVDEGILLGGKVRGTGSKQTVLIDGRIANGADPVVQLGGAVGTTDNLIHITSIGKVTGLGSAAAPAVAVGMSGKSGKIVNEGTINAIVNDGAGIGFTNFGDTDSNFSVVNSGTIRAASFGIANRDIQGTITITNTGTIIGGEGGFPYAGTTIPYGAYTAFATQIVDNVLTVVASTTVETIYNSGLMVGNINLDGGADYYEGRNGRVQGEVHGGSGADKLFAGVGDDRLFGDDGADMLMGGAGADYLNGGAGTDTVLYASATTGVTVSLANSAINTGEAAGDVFVSIENITGSGFNDILVGNGAANILSGGAGNDTLNGLAGNDVLAGGAGKDNFVFAAPLNSATNVDRITDFNVADDTIRLENSYFTALTTTGVLAPAAFQANNTGQAADTSDRIIYETDTGNLFYDPDGTGAAASVLIARLSADLLLTNADFIVI